MSTAHTSTAALALAEMGMSVIPVGAGPDGKRPLIDWAEHQRSRATGDEINDWWHRWPRAGVGIVTGPISGIVVIDIDPRHGGDVPWRDLTWRHGSPEHTWTVHTPSGGMHVYFRLPAGRAWRNTSPPGLVIGPGIDTRCAGGYAIAPPSTRPDGRRYEWALGGCPWSVSPAEPAAELADPPAWLASMLDDIEGRRTARQGPREPSSPPPRVATHGAYLRAAVDRELDAVRGAPDGARNTTLNRAAWNLGRFVADGALSGDAVAAALHHAAVSAGLEEREAAATIASGLRSACTRSAA